jgi:hypothetical protein
MFKTTEAKVNAMIAVLVIACTIAMICWKSGSIISETIRNGAQDEVAR